MEEFSFQDKNLFNLHFNIFGSVADKNKPSQLAAKILLFHLIDSEILYKPVYLQKCCWVLP